MINKTKIFATLATILLLVLLLVLRLVLGDSNIYYLIASIDAALIFLVLVWVSLQLSYEEESNFAAKKFRIIVIILVTLLLAAVVVLCIKLGFSRTFYLILAADIVTILVYISYIFVHAKRVRRRVQVDTFPNSEGEEVRIEYTYLQNLAGLPRAFKYDELKFATKNFQTSIGKGGSGSVFRGVLTDGSKIAVKRIDGEVHGPRQFLTEISVIASVQHINLVRLLGYCLAPENGRFLVYEFIENGSLDAWVFSKNNNREQGEIYLSWPLRYQVAVDVAKALAYLHHDCRSRILHLDIKPENILLDEDFRARVADFGISKLMEKDDSAVLTTVRGTRGYMAPEWFYGDGISEKSDVYSYGLVLLELIGGQRNLQRSHEQSSFSKTSYFPKIVSEKLREGKLMEVLDEKISKNIEVDESEIRKMVCVALWCIQDKVEMRPSMALVVDMLEGYIEIAEPPETKMFMVDLLAGDSTMAVVDSNGLRIISHKENEFPLMSTDSFGLSV